MLPYQVKIGQFFSLNNYAVCGHFSYFVNIIVFFVVVVIIIIIINIIAASPEPRMPRSGEVRFHIGQVIRHKKWKYRGVIIGWDNKAKVSIKH